jgi:alginate O-acetyltransferase complex protein AlgI
MAWGFFKKLVIADRLAIYVNAVYNSPENYSGMPLILATYFFAFQIYCDFSGYSDIAIGTSKIMGYDLMTNFNRPYFSKSISEFWKRWHISLSTWFKDYVYIPLGGNKVSKSMWYRNLFLTFMISGLWHGAN